jgi:hypothetical protein
MTREEIHKLPWKAQEYINELERKLTLTDVVGQSEQLFCYPCEAWTEHNYKNKNNCKCNICGNNK